jgi:hypothetical protein
VTNQDRNKAWGFTLFGDDIRAEVGGKLSLMGMYQGDMFFPSNMALPFLIPKLAILIVYYEIHGAIQEDFLFKISYGTTENVIMELPAPKREVIREETPAAPRDDNPSEDSERIFNMRIPVALSPFNVDRVGRLRVRAHYSDGKILRLGSLWLRQASEAEFQAMLGLKPTQ